MPSITPLDTILKRLRAQYEQLGEEIAALEATVSQQATPGQQAKQLLGVFGRQWQKVYGQKFIAHYPKDIPICKRILKGLTLEEAERRAMRYLADSDGFLRDAKHPLGLFATKLNKYGNGDYTERAAEDHDLLDEEPPVECQHQPRCHNDVQHTRRTSMELRTR